MNIELTERGRKRLFNWDNVVEVGPPRYDNKPNVKTELYCKDNIVWHIDETYEEVKKIVQEEEQKKC